MTFERITWDVIKEMVLKMYKNKEDNFQQVISIAGDEYDLEVSLIKRKNSI